LLAAPGRGRADCYAAVRFDAALETGWVARMRFTAADGGSLIGVPAA
jgi:hypothetical protein